MGLGERAAGRGWERRLGERVVGERVVGWWLVLGWRAGKETCGKRDGARLV